MMHTGFKPHWRFSYDQCPALLKLMINEIPLDLYILRVMASVFRWEFRPIAARHIKSHDALVESSTWWTGGLALALCPTVAEENLLWMQPLP